MRSGFPTRTPLIAGAAVALIRLGIAGALFLPRLMKSDTAAAGDLETPAIAAEAVTQEIEDTLATGVAATVEAVAALTEEPTATNTLEPTATATTPPTATHTPSITPSPTLPTDQYVEITGITNDGSTYTVEYETYGFQEILPGTHIHFFFATVPAEPAGLPGSGPWKLYGGPRPFTGYKPNERPAGATQLCARVANPDHSLYHLESGNCFDLP